MKIAFGRTRGRCLATVTLLVGLVSACASGAEEPVTVSTTSESEDTMTEAEGQASQDVDPPIFEGSTLEWVHAMAACFEDAGFSVVVDEEEPTWLPASRLPEEQSEVWRSTFPKCEAEVGVLEVRELTEPEIRALYDDYVAAGECLEELGYEISEPPSIDAWVESWDTGPWAAHGELGRVSEAEWNEVNEKCPQPGQE